MIRPTPVKAARVLALAQTQIATLKARPELEEAVLASRSVIEARLAEVKARVEAHASAAEAVKAAKNGIHVAMFELKELLGGNIDVVTEIFGMASAEREELGGKRRRVQRRSPSPEAAAPAADAPAQP